MLQRILDEADARQLPALIAEWEHATDERFWIARALRIDLALLVERPALVVPCLYRRCAFLGDEGLFYRERPAPPADFAALRALVRAWAARTPRPWLRAVRPLPTPLDGALREEYRGTDGSIWASADGAWIGTITERVAWDRATGRRLTPANIVEVAVPMPRPWTFVKEEDARIVLVRGRTVDISLAGGRRAFTADTIAAELVVVRGDEPFQAPYYFLVDTGTASIRWGARGQGLCPMLRGDTLVVIELPNSLREHDLATGEVRRSATLPGTGITVLGDGMLATRSEAFSVWDFDAIQTPQARPRAHGDVHLSRDGTRIVTGSLLCDASTGEAIAALPLYQPRTAGEGPQLPHHARAFAGDTYCEHSDDGLARWRITDGAALPTLHGRPTHGGDHCAWDPHGRWHALWSDRGVLEIWPLAEGPPLAQLRVGPPHRARVAASADGEQILWEVDGSLVGVHLAAPTQIMPMSPVLRAPGPTVIRPQRGLLVVGEAAIPCDGPVVAMPDERVFASWAEHYVLES